MKNSSQLENILRNPSAPLTSQKSVSSPVNMGDELFHHASEAVMLDDDNILQERV